jgi:hypothetical protein
MSFGFGANPFDIGLPGIGLAARSAPPEWRRPLPQAESESFVKDLAGRGASGLGYVASALDKPGRAVRGLLGGKPGEALAAIPFSDSLGLTNPDDAVSGRKLLDDANVTSRGDKGWGAWGLGLAAEMALDPLTYLTFGAKAAVTPTGRALANEGLTRGMSRRQLLAGFNDTESAMRAAGTPAHVIEHAFDAKLPVASSKMEAAAAKANAPIKDAPLSGLVGVGLPFRDPSFVLGTGNKAQAVAGKMDAAGDWLRFGNPVGRYLGAHFDTSVGGATTAALQRGFREAGRPTQEAAKRQAARQYFDATSGINDLIAAGHSEADVVSAVNLAREGLPMTGVDPALAAQATPVGRMMKSYGDDQMREIRATGAPTESLNDKYVDYGPRNATTIERHGLNAKGARSDTVAPVKTASDVHRKSAFRDVPGGTEMIKRLAMDFAGEPATATAADILDRIKIAAQDAGSQLDPDEVKALTKKSEELAGVIGSLSPTYKEGKVPYYSPNIPHAIELRGARHVRQMGATEATTSALANMARPAAELGDEGVPLREALLSAKLKTTYPVGGTAEGAAVRVLKKLAPKGQGPLDPADMADADKVRGLLDSWAVPRSELDPLISQWDKMRAPTNAVQPIRVLDSATNAFKNLAYTTWLSSHVRNLGSGKATNVIDNGLGIADDLLSLQGIRDTATAADIKRAFKDMPAMPDDAAARRWLRGQAYVNAGVFAGHNSATDLAGTGQELVDNWAAGNRITPMVPGEGRTGTSGSLIGDMAGLAKEAILGKKDAAGNRVTSPLDFFGQSGLYDKTTGALKSKDTFSPLAAGRVVGTNVEDFNRLSSFIGGVRKGLSPEEAGRVTSKSHINYGDLTDFEKKVMRRVVPFYTFMSRNLPLQLEHAITRPSRLTTQLRPLDQMRGGYTPDWISSGAAIPMGENPENGTSRYVSQLGLPIEEAFERLKFRDGKPDVLGTAMAYAAGLNPYLKGPLEALSGKQFFSGRNLEDLRPSSAGSLGGALSDENAGLLTQIISNSPATRFATSLDRAIDDRKSVPVKLLNMLTGVRVTDVDMNKTMAVEARDSLERLLQGRPHIAKYSKFYVRPGEGDGLTGDEVRMMQMYTEMQARAREYAERNRAASR